MPIKQELKKLLAQSAKMPDEKVLSELKDLLGRYSNTGEDGGPDDELWNEFNEISAAIESSLLLARVDINGIILKVNANFQIVTGYSREELIGESMAFLSAGLHDDAYLAELWDKIQHGSVWRGEIKKKTRDGQILWLNATIIPIVGSDGNIDHFLSFYIDISRRKKAEGDLELFYQLLNLSSDAILVFNEKGKIIYANEKSITSLEYQREELIGMSLVDIEEQFRSKADWDGFFAKVKANSSGILRQGTYRSKSGDTLPVEVNARYMKLGGKSYVISVIRDITERLEGEALMHKTQHILSEAQLLAKIASFEIDLREKRVIHSENAWQVLGFPNSDSFSIQQLIEQIHQDDILQVRDAWNRVTQKGESARVEFRIWSYRQEIVHVLGLAQVLKDDSNDDAYILCTAQNITESVEARLDMEKRTRELEKRNKELDQFAHIVSHDLKSPLRAIHNLTEWIRESQDTTEQQSYITMLQRRVQRMENLINGILHYSSAGRKSEAKSLFSAYEVVMDICDSLRTVRTDVRFMIDDLPRLNEDHLAFEQVMSNLISNAIKHNPQPGAEVRIAYRRQSNMHRFEVIDNGPGIDPRFREKIFHIFQTLDTKDKSENTGVGLAIVKKLCDEKGWLISLESEPGKGSAFILEILS